MNRILYGPILLSICSLAACQRQDRTLVDLLEFPDEVRTVVIAPEYETWYQSAGEPRLAERKAKHDPLAEKYEEENDEDCDVEEAGETSDDEYNDGDQAAEDV